MLKDSTDPPALAGKFPPSGNRNTLRKYTIIAHSPQPRHIALCSFYFRPELFSDHCFAWHVLAATSFAAHSGDYTISMLDAVLALTHTASLQLSMPCHAMPCLVLSALPSCERTQAKTLRRWILKFKTQDLQLFFNFVQFFSIFAIYFFLYLICHAELQDLIFKENYINNVVS